jgi:cell division protein FtsZ
MEDEIVDADNDSETNLITTTEIIKNINVVYDEVLDHNAKEEDFIITPVQEVKEDIVEELEEEQITLTFDLPLSFGQEEEEAPEVEEKTVFALEEVKDLDVNDHIEIVPVTEANEEGETRYALDDFMTYESSINEAETKIQPEVEEEIVFEKKTIESQVTEEDVREEIDPMNSPISELLIERADERRRKMKDFNYKFNTAKIDEIEKEPAYKRQGVNLEESQHSSDANNASRTSVATDDNDDIQLRSNNSFLHDNVD